MSSRPDPFDQLRRDKTPDVPPLVESTNGSRIKNGGHSRSNGSERVFRNPLVGGSKTRLRGGHGHR